MWIDIPNPRGGSLLFRFDPVRDLVEVKHKNAPPILVDLKHYRDIGAERQVIEVKRVAVDFQQHQETADEQHR